jgi:predicted NBD/HSP70 family sugar kinase
VDSRSGRVVFSPNLGWRGVDLADALEVATGLQTFVENDANALAVHEQLVGSAVGKNNFAAILLDDGIGAGLIIDGQLVHGTSGLAGELGHIVIRPGGPICRCGNTGCLESIASIRGILNAIGRETGTIPRSIEAADTLATQGDTAACRAFAAAGGAMGQAISIVQNMLNVERVLIAVPAVLDPSSESRASDLFQTSLVRATSEAAFSSAASDCTIDIHHFARSGEYGAQGAASIVVRQFVQAPLSWRPVATIENTEQEPFDEAAYAREFDADMGDLIAPLIDNTMRS